MRANPTVLFLLVLLLAGQLLYGFAIFTDDPFCSFRYARNLAHGHGLVFNPGERVEGYTNFLWTILLAVPIYLHGDPVFWSKVFGILCNMGTVLLLMRWVTQGTSRVDFRLTAPLLLVLNPDFIHWGGGGLETSLFLFWVTAAVITAMNRNSVALPALSLAGAALTRPEGVLLAALVFTGMMLSRAGNIRERFVRVAKSAFIFLICYVPYFIWRLLYYGKLFPNSYYVKVGWSLDQIVWGLGYWSHHIRTAGGVIFLIIIITAIIRSRKSALIIPAVVLIGFHIYIILVGGDWMPYHRFFVPLSAIEMMLIASALNPLWIRHFPGRKTLAVITVVFLAVTPFIPDSPMIDRFILDMKNHLRNKKNPTHGKVKIKGKLRTRSAVSENWIQNEKSLGLWLKEHAPKHASIALGGIGIIPYYSELYTTDFFGICDPEFAEIEKRDALYLPGHRKINVDHILDKKPTYIIFNGRTRKGTAEDNGFWVNRLGFKNNRRFREEYTPIQLTLHHHRYRIYKRKEI